MQIPDDKLDLLKEMILLMGGRVKDVEKLDVVTEDSIVNVSNKFPYHHPRANIAVDVVVFGVLPDKDELCVFVQRDSDDEKWCLPGRFMHCGKSFENEKDLSDEDNWDLERTRKEALNMEWPIQTTYKGKVLQNSVSYIIKENDDLVCQLEVMSKVDRDSRECRVVSVPYITLVNVNKDKMPDSSINEYVAQWMPLSKLINDDGTSGNVKLDHDHLDILKNGCKRLFQEIRTRPVGMGMLPAEFEIMHLINIYNLVFRAMGVSMERSNLRKLLLDRGVIVEVTNQKKPGKGGAAYRFDFDRYNEIKRCHNFGLNPRPKDKKKAFD